VTSTAEGVACWVRACWLTLRSPLSWRGAVMVAAVLVALADTLSTWWALTVNEWAAEGVPTTAWMLAHVGYAGTFAVMLGPWLVGPFLCLSEPLRPGVWRTAWRTVAFGTAALIALRTLVVACNVAIALAA